MTRRWGLAAAVAGLVTGEVAAWATRSAGGVAGLAAVGAIGVAAGSRWTGWACGRTLAVGLVAAATGAWRMHAAVAPAPPDDVSRLPLPLRTLLEGDVVASPDVRDGRTVLVVAARSVGTGTGRRTVQGRVRLSLRGPAAVTYGDRLRVATTLRRPRNFRTPGAFDFVGHLRRHRIRVTGSVQRAEQLSVVASSPGGLRAGIERWRAGVVAAIAAAVPGPAGAVLAALVVGDERGVDERLRSAFTRTGLVHVLSVSGLHVGLVAGAGFLLLRAALGRSERMLLAVDVARIAAIGSVAPVLLYAALAGLEVATLRSAAMVVGGVLASVVGRQADVLRSLGVAALVVVGCWPGATFEMGFQLSFASVLGIVLGTRRWAPGAPVRASRLRRWAAMTRAAALVSPCATIATLPLVAFHFQQVSLVGVLANPLLVPLFGAVVLVPGLAGACLVPVAPTWAGACFVAAGRVLAAAVALVHGFARPAWAAAAVPTPAAIEVAAAYVALAGALAARRWSGRVALAVGVVVLLGGVGRRLSERCAPDRLQVAFLDVGQGDAAVAELPGGAVVVIDAGGFPGSTFDTGAAVVAPYLRHRAVRRVDVVVVTHAHPDHFGGVATLLGGFAPRELWWSGTPGRGVAWERLRAAIVASGVRVRRVAAGSLPGGIGAGRVLHPPAGWTPPSVNDSSLVLALRHGGTEVLLTGDLEWPGERSLLGGAALGPVTLLKVPHHGSRTSSTPPFVDAAAPRVAVVSVGADNRYRLPASEVLARYRARGACVLRTDRCGTVRATTDGRTLSVVATAPGCRCPAMVVTPPG